MYEDAKVAHYDRLASKFDLHWAHSPQFVAWMSANITNRLDPRPGEPALDLGCGTGLYTRCLAERTGTVTCADPSEGMLQQVPATPTLVPLRATAQEVIDGGVALPHDRYDVILAKEILHHIPRSERTVVLRGIANLLAPGGRMLLILMPPTITHPLFDAALRRYEQHSIDPSGVAAALEAVGLRVTVTSESFRLELSKDRWLTMVRDRYMSLLAKFDDQELQAGIAEIDTRHPGAAIGFHDRYIFIRARRIKSADT